MANMDEDAIPDRSGNLMDEVGSWLVGFTIIVVAANVEASILRMRARLVFAALVLARIEVLTVYNFSEWASVNSR